MSRRDYDAEIRSLQNRMRDRQRRHEGVADLQWRIEAVRLAQLQAEIRADKKSKSRQSVAA